MTELAPTTGWKRPLAARLATPPISERGLLFRVLSQFSRRLGRKDVPDIISVLHINPRLFWAWLFFASRLMPYGRLPGRLREMIILRTAWNCRSRYEWGQHVDIGLSAGLTDREVVDISKGPASLADMTDRAVLLACDEICADQGISDDTWSTLSNQFNNKLLIEILMLIGHYIMIAGFLNSTGINLEFEVEEKLQAFHRRVGLT